MRNFERTKRIKGRLNDSIDSEFSEQLKHKKRRLSRKRPARRRYGKD